MIPHDRPDPPFQYDLNTEIAALRHYRDTKEHRQIPSKAPNNLLIATWNLTNLGLQQRNSDDYRLMAEIISWFDIVAVQEIAEDLLGLRQLLAHLPAYKAIVSDPGGNNERLGFIYEKDKVELLELVGEVAVPPSQHRYIRLRDVSGTFTGFDRNPYICSFKAEDFTFMLVSVHLYYGKNRWYDIDRRTLETFAVARWAKQRQESDLSYCQNVVVLGDFNLEKRSENDRVYRALRQKGLKLPNHSTRIGSNLEGDKEYDQIAFLPGPSEGHLTGNSGVFDFDGGLFQSAWVNRQPDFKDIVKFHVADHRPLWTQFSIQD